MYKECAGETEAFRINTSGTDFKTPSPADIGSNCTEDFVVIDGKCLHRVQELLIIPHFCNGYLLGSW